MCGRFTLGIQGNMLADWFDIHDERVEVIPRYNIAPTQEVPVVRSDGNRNTFTLMRWGLVPFFSKDGKSKYPMINARAETVETNNAYKGPFKSKRCLIPVDGFYEWKKLDAKTKQPMRILLKSEEPFAFAGIWEWWRPKETPEAEDILSCSIITTVANSLIEPIHDRMPVILPPDLYSDWMNPTNQDIGELKEYLLPYDSGLMKAYPVSTLVNSVKNQGAELIGEVAG